MKITKYPQSCFVIESAGKKIMIDPGVFFAEKFKAKDFLDVSAVLFTHQHMDHLDITSTKLFAENKIPIYGNADVVAKLAADGMKIIEIFDRKKFSVAGFEFEPVDLPHCQLLSCKTCGKKFPVKPCPDHQNAEIVFVDGPPNTGFVIDNIFFHPGDGIELRGVTIKNACIPIVGPTIDHERAGKFVKSLGAKTIIPMHYDFQKFPAELRDQQRFAKLNPGNIGVRILKNGESTEL